VRWEAWAPPLNPPAARGLDRDDAQDIADAWWDTDPHLAAALMWEAYAMTLPPAPSLSQVSTGVQSVSYQPAMPGGELGLALSQAARHRSLASNMVSVPAVVEQPAGPAYPPGWWEVDPWA
jgi:hypothetical protein